jgi:hypothetical protein
MQLLRYHVPAPPRTHPTAFVQDHLDDLLQLAMSKSTEVPRDGIVRHAEVPKDFVRDSRNPRRRRRRRTQSTLHRTARSFDTYVKVCRVVSTHRCFPSEFIRRTGRLARSSELQFRPNHQRLIRNYDVRDNAARVSTGKLPLPLSLQICAPEQTACPCDVSEAGFALDSVDRRGPLVPNVSKRGQPLTAQQTSCRSSPITLQPWRYLSILQRYRQLSRSLRFCGRRKAQIRFWKGIKTLPLFGWMCD